MPTQYVSIQVLIQMVAMQTESLKESRRMLEDEIYPYDIGYIIGRIHEKERQIEWLEKQIESARRA